MVDNRIYTFLKLCKLMNYHETAKALNMTQPAVTQHIKYLENLYNCKLFTYKNKKLTKTPKCLELETGAISMVSLSESTAKLLAKRHKTKLRVGATKTIGEYTIEKLVARYVLDKDYDFSLLIDNTKRLLERLNNFELDVLLLEGYFDKDLYGHYEISREEMVGICSLNHPFANKEVDLSDVFSEHIILREKGSGTRDVFEHFLTQQNCSFIAFKEKSIINSNRLIENLVKCECGIAFVYDTVPKNNKELAIFRIKGSQIFHSFNFVFIKGAKIQDLMLELKDSL